LNASCIHLIASMIVTPVLFYFAFNDCYKLDWLMCTERVFGSDWRSKGIIVYS
jgi:hypothetical protein